MTEQWWTAAPAIAVAVAVLLVPGLVATAPLRLALVARVALSGLVGVVCLGVAGVVFSLAGIPFAAWQTLVPAAVIALAAALGRRRLPALSPRRERVRWWWLAIGWAAAAVLVAVVAFWQVASPEQFSQTYDNVFHLGATAHILTTGDASSLTLRTLIETDRTWAFYPSGWHSLAALVAQLTGVGVPVAFNASWIAVCAAIWLPGAAWLAQVIARGFEPGRVALVALPLGTAFGAMPYALLSWGTLYPTFLATALLPAAVALPIAVWDARRCTGRTALLALLGASVLVIGAAIAFSQPRVGVTWALLLAPFVAREAVTTFRAAWRGGARRRRRAIIVLTTTLVVLIVGAASAFAYLVLRLGLFERPLDERLGGPQARATQSIVEGLVQVLLQAWPTGSSGAIAFPSLLLAAFVAIGAVALWRRRLFRWAIVSYLLLAVLFALAAGSDDVVSKLLTALWYKDRYRLSSAIPVLGVAFAAIGVLVVARWLARRAVRRQRAARAASVLLVWLTAATSALALVLTGASSSVALVFDLPAETVGDEVVSERQAEFLREAGALVPEDQRLLGDPWDGSALSLLFAGREPVFPHVTGQWDADRLELAHRLDTIEEDPRICAALDALRVRYVVYDPHEFGGGDPIGNQFFAVHAAVERGLFTPVLTDGTSVLYRIDQCGPLPAA